MRLVSLLFLLVPSILPSQTRHRGTLVATAFVVTTAALLPMDVEISEEFREPAQLRSHALQRSAAFFNYAGGPGAVTASVAVLGLGVLRHDTTWTAVGVRSTEALVIGATATALLKGAFGRLRPFVNTQKSDVWYIGRGFSGAGRTSFPSGHATAAFAVATAVSRELHVRAPKASRIATPLLFGGATLVAAARVYGAHHWASDVVAGAGVGTFTGYLVTRHDAEAGPGGVRIRF